MATTPSSLSATRALAIWGDPSSPKAGRATSRPSLEGARATSSSPSLTTVPTRTGGTLSKRAISMSATREASMNPSFNKRSSGGYPMSESSGVSTKSAPAEAAWVRKRPSVSTFCANPPTTAFIWAMASRITGTQSSLPVRGVKVPGQRSHAVNKTRGVARPRCTRLDGNEQRQRRSDFEVSGRIHLDRRHRAHAPVAQQDQDRQRRREAADVGLRWFEYQSGDGPLLGLCVAAGLHGPRSLARRERRARDV